MRTNNTDQMRFPQLAALDFADGPTGQEDNAQNDHAEQSHEGAGAEGAIVEIAVGQCARYRR